MLSISFIRENVDLVKRSAKEKGYDVNIDKLLDLDNKRRIFIQEVDELRANKNQISDHMKGGRPDDSLISKASVIKDELSSKEVKLSDLSDEYDEFMGSIPNIIEDDVPSGGENDGVEVRVWGDKKQTAVDHQEVAEKRGWLDFERGAKVAGSKFYYLKGDLALLENAITQFALEMALKDGFELLSVPALVNSRTATGTGFTPRTSEQSDEYHIEGEDLSLIATAEIPITGYHADEIIDESELPKKYMALSPSFRKEAGTYGKHDKGLYRVHQFNKLELYVLCAPEKSREMHNMILALEEKIWQAISIPYRVVNIAAGDLGAPATKKYDIEYWSPIDGAYRELTSASNCTDFQARNLSIRMRRKSGEVEVLHTLNGTAVALARTLVAVIENYQTEDGKLRVPEVLRPYMGDREVL